MVIFHEAESLPVDFVLHKAIEVSLIAKMSEKLTNIVHGPRVEGGTSRMSVGCMGGGGERERERERERDDSWYKSMDDPYRLFIDK